MNNKYSENSSALYVLIPPAPFSAVAKKGELNFLAPLCRAERGWGEYVRTDK